MKKTRNKIQTEALTIWKENNNIGTICLSTGSGKSKVAIDAIKQGNYKNILITSPRTNLKENWKKELEKWGIFQVSSKCWSIPRKRGITLDNNIILENIQTCYKWTKEQIQQFDLIIFDEIHTQVSNKYGRLLYNAAALEIDRIGLTATPDKDCKIDAEEDDYFADWNTKEEVYDSLCPIIYEYYDSAKDGIVNKRRYLVLKYELSNEFKVIVGNKKKQWETGELDHYLYLTDQIFKGQKLMAQTGSIDWFTDAANWFWKGKGDPDQKRAARIYLQAIKYRKEFLGNLNSSSIFANQIKEVILKNQNNKVLLFSENINQAKKLSKYSIHSKQDSNVNSELLNSFDSGKIRELASVRTLTLGLNIKGANYIIRESFNSSETNTNQIHGRSDRLDVDDIATVIWIVPVNTQSEQWYNKAMKDVNVDEITDYNNIMDLIKEL